MDIAIPDLTGLSLTAIVSLTIIVGLIDTGWAWLTALGQHVFNPAYAANFLYSHGRAWFAIGALAVIGHGVPSLGVPAIGAATDAAVIGLAAYVVVTIKSLAVNTVSSAAPSK